MSESPAPSPIPTVNNFNTDFFFNIGNALTFETANKYFLAKTGGNVTYLNVLGNLDCSTLTVAGLALNLSAITGVTPGICTASKALIVDSNRDITNINQVSVNGTNVGFIHNNGTISMSTYLGAPGDDDAQWGTTTNHSVGFFTNNQSSQLSLTADRSVNITAHNGSTIGLKLGGTLVTSTAIQLNYLSGITPGTATASKALVLDASSNIADINQLRSFTLLAGDNTVKNSSSALISALDNTMVSTDVRTYALGRDTGDRNSCEIGFQYVGANSNSNLFSIGFNTVGRRFFIMASGNVGIAIGTPLYRLDVNGTFNCSSTLSIGSNILSDASRNLTALSLDINGNDFVDSSRNVTASSLNVTTLYIGGILATATSAELNYLSGITPGTATASKALVLDASSNIININALTATNLTGTLQTAAQPNITSVGTLTSLTTGAITASDKLTTTISNATGTLVSYGTWTNSSGPINVNLQLSNVGSAFGNSTAHPLRFSTNNLNRIYINSAGQINIGSTDQTTYLFQVPGTCNITTLYIGGILATATSAELNYLSGITPGTATASKALVLDASSNIADINQLRSFTLLAGDNTVKNSSSALISALDNTMVSTDVRTYALGRDTGDRNSCEIGFQYVGANSNSNLFSIGFNTVGRRFFIMASGNVGIAIGTPLYRLDVNGTFNCSSTLSIGSNILSDASRNLTALSLDINGNDFVDSSRNVTASSLNVISGGNINFSFGTSDVVSMVYAATRLQTDFNNFNIYADTNTSNAYVSLANYPIQSWSYFGVSDLLFYRRFNGLSSVLQLQIKTSKDLILAAGTSQSQILLVNTNNQCIINTLRIDNTLADTVNSGNFDIVCDTTRVVDGTYSRAIRISGVNASPCIVECMVNRSAVGSSVSSYIGSQNGHKFGIMTNGTARLTIDSANSYVGIGNSSPSCPLDISGSASLSYGTGLQNVYQSSGSTGSWIVTNLGLGPVSVNTSIRCSGAINCGSIVQVSDRRLKKNIKPLKIDLDKFYELEAKEFQMIDTNEYQIGFIAQELMNKKITELVGFTQNVKLKAKDEVLIDGVQLNIKYDRIAIINFMMIQKLIKKIEYLENQINLKYNSESI